MTLLGLFLIMLLLIINYVAYKIKKFSKTFFIITNIILLLNFILIYALYYNNLSLGFNTGIVIGDLNGIYIDDEYKYFYESSALSQVLQTHGFIAWLTHTLPYNAVSPDGVWPPYGFYNPFVCILTLLNLLGITNVTELLIIKLIFVLINSYFIFEISNNLCNKKFKYLPLIIFNLIPSYLLINITLSRDLIIITTIIYIFKFIILKDKNYKKLIIPLICLSVFRSYIIITLFGTLLLLFRNTKKLFSKIDIAFIVLIFAGVYLLLKIYIPIQKFVFLKTQLIELHGNSIYTPFNLTLTTLRDIFIKSPYLHLLKTNSLYSIMISLSSIVYMLLGVVFILKILLYTISTKSEKYNMVIKFSLYFILLTSYILMMRDGFITSRLTNMWFFTFIIIIFMPFDNFISKYIKKNTDS